MRGLRWPLPDSAGRILLEHRYVNGLRLSRAGMETLTRTVLRQHNIDEQADARERRSRVDLQWTIYRRRPVIGDVLCPMADHKRFNDLTPEERHRDRLRHFPTMLERWRGGRAQPRRSCATGSLFSRSWDPVPDGNWTSISNLHRARCDRVAESFCWNSQRTSQHLIDSSCPTATMRGFVATTLPQGVNTPA